MAIPLSRGFKRGGNIRIVEFRDWSGVVILRRISENRYSLAKKSQRLDYV